VRRIILLFPFKQKTKQKKMTHGAPAKKNPTNDEEVIPPPDGGWGWAVVFGSFMIHIIGKKNSNFWLKYYLNILTN
jgi:hypothetical protein